MTDSRSEWSRHWPLVMTATLGVSLGSVGIYAIGQFSGALQHQFGWSRTQVLGGTSFPALGMLLLSGPIGRAIDRHDLRRLAIPGVVLCTGALAGFSLANGNPVLWQIAWALYGLGAAITAPTLWVAAVSTTFERGRNLAMAIVLSGAGLSSAIGPLLARFLIDAFGWREAFLMLAVSWGGLCLLMTLIAFRDRRPKRADRASGSGSNAEDPNARAILTSGRFLRLAAAVFLVMTAIGALMVNLAPLLIDARISEASAAKVASLAGIGVIAGKLTAGWLFGRVRPAIVSSGAMALLAVAGAIFLSAGSDAGMAALGSLCLGAASGAMMAITACAVASLFPIRDFGTVYGALIAVMALAGVIGPLAANLIRDNVGSYGPMEGLAIAFAVIGGLLLGNLSADAPARERAGEER